MTNKQIPKVPSILSLLQRAARVGLIFLFAGIAFGAYAESAEDYVKSATEYLNKGDVKAAIIELKNALQKDPKNAGARYLLGTTYLRVGDGASAEKELDRARRLGLGDEKVLVPLARAYLLQGHADKVLEEIKDDEKLPANVRAEVITLQAQALMLLKQFDTAKGKLETALQLDAKSINAKLGLSRLAMINKEYAQAEKYVDEVIAQKPESDEAWTVKGEIARLSGDLKTAKTNFDKAIKLDPNNVAAYLGSASASIGLQEYDQALKIVDEIRRKIPNHLMANYLRAVASYRKQDLTAAEESLQIVLRAYPEHLPSLLMMGAIHYNRNQLEQAEFALKKVVTAQPENTLAVKLLAATRIKAKQPQQAVSIMEPIAGNNSQDAQFLALLGSAYMQTRNADKGLEYLQKAVEISPNAAAIHTQLALAQLASGRQTEAVEQLETAMDLGPELLQADILLIMVHMRNSEFDKALEQAKNLQKKLKDSAVPYNLMGAAYLGLKQRDNARQQFNKALEVDPKFTPADMNLARMDEQDGELKKAKQRYENIEKKQRDHVQALMSLARLAEAEGDSEKALRYVVSAREQNPKDIVPGLYLVQYHLAQQQALKALSIARDLSESNPNNPFVLKSLGMAQFAADEKNNAIATFTKLTELYPESVEGYYLVGKAYLQVDNLDAAKKSLDQALKLDSKHIPSLLSLAELELRKNQTEKAVQISHQIQKDNENSSVGYQLEGDIYLYTKDYAKAATAYEKGFNKVKTSELLLKYYDASKNKGDSQKVFALLEKWVEEHPKDVNVSLLLANEYQSKNDNKKAIQIYKSVLQKDPNNVIALNNLAWLFDTQKSDEGLKYAEKAYELVPQNPAVTDTYGWLLVKNGKVGEGLILLQQAVVQAPHISEIRYHLAVAMHKSGQNNEAKKELERVISANKDFPEIAEAKALLEKLSN